MHIPRPAQILAVASALALTACSNSIGPLQIPAAETVSSIEGTISSSYDLPTKTYRDSVTITDASQIRRVVSLLEALNSDMSVPFDTFPLSTHTLAFTDSGGVNLVVYIGLNWIGGRNNGVEGSKNRLRSVTDEQRSELLNAVGLKDYRFTGQVGSWSPNQSLQGSVNHKVPSRGRPSLVLTLARCAPAC